MPAGRVARGRLALPPSKSLTNRYLNLALLAGAPVVIERPLEAEDTRVFLGALEKCGFRVEEEEKDSQVREDRQVGEDRRAAEEGEAAGEDGGEWRLVPPSRLAGGELDCGASGTMLRFLTAAVTVLPGSWRLDGVPRLRERPVGPLIEALRLLGARIRCLEKEGYAPLAIDGGSLEAGTTTLDAGASSQFLSALLMAALRAPGEVMVEVGELTSEPYLNLTLAAVVELGGHIEELPSAASSAAPRNTSGTHVARRRFVVRPSSLAAARVRVEGDASGACYAAAAAALTGGDVVLAGLPRRSAQGDRGFLDLLAAMGAEVAWSGTEEVVVRGAPGGALRALDTELSGMPDQVPTLAALAPFARGTTRIRDVPHLRWKESDRLQAMASELRAAGVSVEEREDGLTIGGCWAGLPPDALPAAPVVVDPHGDHRIAMSMALVGLRRPGLAVADPGVVAKSYPDFWRHLEALLAA